MKLCSIIEHYNPSQKCCDPAWNPPFPLAVLILIGCTCPVSQHQRNIAGGFTGILGAKNTTIFSVKWLKI